MSYLCFKKPGIGYASVASKYLKIMNYNTLQSELKSDLNCFLSEQYERFARENLLKIDLHCLRCGLPVVAYNTKGPKDIICDNVCGYLVKTEEQMAEKIITSLSNPQQQQKFKKAAVKRAKNYDANSILERFIADVGLKY